MIAALSVYAEDIGGLGLNFLFPSHEAFARAKLELSNVTYNTQVLRPLPNTLCSMLLFPNNLKLTAIKM
jgi:hypothetical protein